MIRFITTLLLVLPLAVHAALDPLGCANGGAGLSNAELNDLGFEVVSPAAGTAGGKDNTRLQNAINTAYERRRNVFLRPGTYRINTTLKMRSDRQNTKDQNGRSQYSSGLLGSYCGTNKPEIIFQNGVDTNTGFSRNAANATPMIAVWRAPDTYVASRIEDWRDNQGGRNYNTRIRNLKLTVGNNPGAVAIWMNGAEGSAIQEVDIDATGAFAGTWSVPSSGGHMYKVSVTGGQYGLFAGQMRGGSPPIVGLTLRDQVVAPIAHGHYASLNFIGADIQFDGGQVVQHISFSTRNWPQTNQRYTTGASIKPICTTSGSSHQNGKWAAAFVDSKIELTSSGNQDMFATNGCSLYLRNTYVKGTTNIVNVVWGAKLKASTNSQWVRIPEYAVGRAFSSRDTIKVQSVRRNHNWHWFDGQWSGVNNNVTATQTGAVPGAMISQHFYKDASCNPERNGMVDAWDHGARTSLNDNQPNIQAAVEAAGDDGMVWLRGGTANVSTGVVPLYNVKGTILLRNNTEFCGAANFASRLNAVGWVPSSTSPVIRMRNNATAAPIIRDIQIWLRGVRDSYQFGYEPWPYALDWQSGKATIINVWPMRKEFRDEGDRIQTWIRNQGGGKMYGYQGVATWQPIQSQNRNYTNFAHDPRCQCYRDTRGELVNSPNGRLIKVDGTTNPLTIYFLHCQYTQPATGAICEIANSDNVTIYGSKSETITQGDGTVIPGVFANNPASDIPVNLYIKDSSNFVFVGSEGISQVGANRGVMEVYNSTDVTFANIVIGRNTSGYDNDTGRFLVEMDDDNNGILFGSIATMFRDSTTAVPEPPDTEDGPELRPITPSDFTLKVAKE